MYRSQLMNAGPPDPPPTPAMLARALAHLSPTVAVARCIRAARKTGGLTDFLEETMWLIALRSLVEDGSLTADEAEARLEGGVVSAESRGDDRAIILTTIAIVRGSKASQEAGQS